MKRYFNSYDNNCYSLFFFKKYMKKNDIKELQLFEAKVVRGTGYIFCIFAHEIGELSDCNKLCCQYKPNKGKKNGVCIYRGSLYWQTEKIKILRLK